jgi:hypothetical protein
MIAEILVGTLIGSAVCYALGSNVMLRIQLTSARKTLAETMHQHADAVDRARQSEALLVDARAIFEEQLKRPCVAYFGEEQVKDLGNILVKNLFVPAALAARRELEGKKA